MTMISEKFFVRCPEGTVDAHHRVVLTSRPYPTLPNLTRLATLQTHITTFHQSVVIPHYLLQLSFPSPGILKSAEVS